VTKPRILVVEDDEAVRMMLHEGLQRDEFEVVVASNVRDALKLIANETFDVLLSDLHMPLAGDGFTLVSAMRHTHPAALTIVVSGYPALDEAMSAILHQADEILAKPVRIGELRELIRNRLKDPQTKMRVKAESVASILEREVETTIQNWLDIVDLDAELTCVTLSRNERTGHLPQLLLDLVTRLRLNSRLDAPISQAARDHGAMRLRQGYTATMVVEESRILQVSIFSTLERNLCGVDFSRLLLDVVTIADEVDSQLKQAMFSYNSPIALKSQTDRLAS
jgi:DNA-binding response OmpR family regulator